MRSKIREQVAELEVGLSHEAYNITHSSAPLELWLQIDDKVKFRMDRVISACAATLKDHIWVTVGEDPDDWD